MMVEQVPAAAVAPELLAAMDAARAAIAHVVTLVDDGAGTDLGAQSLVGCLQAWEQIRNTMPVVDSVLIQHGAEQDIPRALTQRSMSQVLVDGLRLSAPEAHRRVTAAAHLAVRHSMLGQPLPPIRPRLAAAQRDGLVTVEQVAIVDDALRRVDRCDPDDVAHGEEILVEAASHLPAKQLRQLAERVVEAIDPDGAVPDEAEQRRRRYVRMSERRDGMWAGEFRLTPELGRKLKDLLDPLTTPATTSHDTDRGTRRFVDDDDRTLVSAVMMRWGRSSTVSCAETTTPTPAGPRPR